MEEIIGYRGFCKKCVHGVELKQQESIICSNKKSGYYGVKVNSVLCAPCFVNDVEKNVKLDGVSFE